MWKKVPHLLVGLTFFITSAYLLRRPVTAWKPPVRVSPAADSGEPHPDNDSLPVPEDTKPYGVLSSLMDKVKDEHEETSETVAKGPPLEVDRTRNVQTVAPKRLLHRRITLKTFQAFGFEVPAHSIRPRVHGTFNSLVSDSGSAGPESENVEVLLLSEEEFREYAHGRRSTAACFSPPSTGAVIDWALDTTPQPLKYYLVLRNASAGHAIEQVDTDFTVSFD